MNKMTPEIRRRRRSCAIREIFQAESEIAPDLPRVRIITRDRDPTEIKSAAERAITILGTTRWRFLASLQRRGETEFNHPFRYDNRTIIDRLSPRDEIAEGDISANLLETCRKRRVLAYRLKVRSRGG